MREYTSLQIDYVRIGCELITERIKSTSATRISLVLC